MNDTRFIELLNEVKQEFSGWDFSFVTETGRIQNELLSWSYGSITMPVVRKATSLLDMGTGGGEFFSLLRPFPDNVFATEGFKPNIPIAKKKLEPLGVTVLPFEKDNELPFTSNQFGLIINKHESYCPAEVRRISKKNGIFLTQQVGGLDCKEINDALGMPINQEYLNWNLDRALKELEEHHFNVLVKKEEFPTQRFYDIGALVYYLKAIPWQIPNFNLEDLKEQLFSLHKKIEKDGYFDAKQHRFLIKAKAI
ncbi:SAM-dependent methyltransferase [Bacillus spongiae]|uniref:SAM-dependent methyltransferase n=2 Tax=Bacillus spongiae TaxID=2683610 RepID=A0ABU8HBT0_9BACI